MSFYNDFKEWLSIGHEIEFVYMNEEYSVTYVKDDNGNKCISFCKFYCEPTDFKDAEDFMANAKIGNDHLSDIWEAVTDITIF